MLDRFFGYKVHSFLHVLGMCVLAFGLPLNKVLMSIGAIWGVSNLILEGNIKTYWQNIRRNTVFLWLAAFCALHIIGLIWSTDFSYALHDIKIKLPLLAVPLALTARPITDRTHLHYILYCVIASLLLTTLLNFGYYNHWFGNKEYIDVREMSLFGSHIRIGILVALGAGLCIYFISTKSSPVSNWIWLLLLGWFSVYTFYSQVLSGTISLLMVFLVFAVFNSGKYIKLVSFFTIGILLTLAYISFVFFKPVKPEKIDYSKLPVKTKEGNPYIHNYDDHTVENNELVFVSVCDIELKREWEKLSQIPYEGFDKSGQLIRATIVRYLASKKFSKDAEGILRLTKTDVKNIENGIASTSQLKTGLIARIYGIRYQLHNTSNPNGHSLLQRLEFWKTGWHIVQNNWIIGVGTGDVQQAFNEQYEKEKSILVPENRLRAHNMYLTVWITFGIAGLLIFVSFLLSYLKLNIKNNELFPLMFMTVAIVTFFFEDTIETQLGVSIFALFTGLYMNSIGRRVISD